jgi:hypothetical protein
MFRGMVMTDISSSDARSRDARDIARRNRAVCGKALSPVMQTAATACELGRASPRPAPPAPPRDETD